MRSAYINEERTTIVQLMKWTNELWCVTSVGTFPGDRQKGHATQLMQVVMDDARAVGVTLVLSIDPSPPVDEDILFRWYTKLGWKPFSLDAGVMWFGDEEPDLDALLRNLMESDQKPLTDGG